MKTSRRFALALGLGSLLVAGGGVALWPHPATHHANVPADLGLPSAGLDALVDEPGPITVESVVGADWHVPLSGLLNLDHPKAKAAHLTDREEAIQVSFHAIHHPTRGTFLIDTGVEHALQDDPDQAALRGPATLVLHVDAFKFHTTTKAWIDAQKAPPAGVFLTHLHTDHVSGMRDVPASAQVYVGPGEATSSGIENLVTAPIADRALEGKSPLRIWAFAGGDAGFEGVLDVFGDQTVFALWVPGHTAGSTAFVVRTPSGPVLFTGDACHTAWGWDNGVEPGSFSSDRPRSADSLARLRAFAARHPHLRVRLGHQRTTESASEPSATRDGAF
jgi:N-acyl homoserine lactone hydrolase